MSPVSRVHDVDGVRVHVVDTHPGSDARPVFLLHGNPDSHTLWDDVVRLLSDDAPPLRFIRPDMPGFGSSPEPPERFDYLSDSTTPLWTGLLHQLGIDQPLTVVLHDFGGPWFLPWVSRNPNQVRGLVVCDSPYHPTFQWHVWARIWRLPWVGELSTRFYSRALVRWEMRRGSKGLPLEYCDRIYEEMTPAMQRCVLRTYRSHGDAEAIFRAESARLNTVLQQIPARVVWGGKDPYLSIDQAHTFGVPVELVDDAGHWTPVEAPEVVAQAVRAVMA